jgi:hypothetical protein
MEEEGQEQSHRGCCIPPQYVPASAVLPNHVSSGHNAPVIKPEYINVTSVVSFRFGYNMRIVGSKTCPAVCNSLNVKHGRFTLSGREST